MKKLVKEMQECEKEMYSLMSWLVNEKEANLATWTTIRQKETDLFNLLEHKENLVAAMDSKMKLK